MVVKGTDVKSRGGTHARPRRSDRVAAAVPTRAERAGWRPVNHRQCAAVLPPSMLLFVGVDRCRRLSDRILM